MKTPNLLIKALNWIAWISAAIGVIIIGLGAYSVILGHCILGFRKLVNYFLSADSFFLFAILLFVFLIKCQCKKE